jgi:F-type H+-transporting ATPase subunit b
MEIIAQTELVSINATLIAQLASFLIFLFLIDRLMFRPLRQTMDARASRVQDLQREVKNQEDQLNKLNAEMRRQEKVLRAEAFGESEKLEESGKQEAQRILQAVQEDIKSHNEKSAAENRVRIERLRQELLNETGPLATTILEAVLGRRLNS